MVLNYATTLDWTLFYRGGETFRFKFLHGRIKPFIKKAKLNVSETFEIATYYTFFGQYHYAYNLTKRVVYRSVNQSEVVFFLKLIYYLDSSLSDKKVNMYFKRTAQLKGDEFCTYFNTPYLNFQILDDPEIREIYCETCSDYTG